MRTERRSDRPLMLALVSPFLAAAMTVAFALVARELPRVPLTGLARYADEAVVYFNVFLAFAGAAAGGLMTRGGPFRRSAVAFGAGACGVALHCALLFGAFMLAWESGFIGD